MKDIVAVTGEYQKDGQTKAEWTKIGVMGEGQNGPYLLLDPAVNLSGVLTKQNMLAAERKRNGDERAKVGKSVMCSIFDRSSQQAPQSAPQGGGVIDDDIPF